MYAQRMERKNEERQVREGQLLKTSVGMIGAWATIGEGTGAGLEQPPGRVEYAAAASTKATMVA